MRPDQYILQQWDTSGSLVRQRVRQVAWFPQRTFEQSPVGERPQPFIKDVKVAGNGEIWVLIQVTDAGWKPRPVHSGIEWSQLDEQYDSVIEVLGKDGGSLHIHQRFDEYLDGFVGESGIYRRNESEVGASIFEVFDLVVAR